MSYTVITKSNKLNISLARTGGQGSKGDSVTNAFVNSSGELIIEVTRSSGEVVQLNAGVVSGSGGGSINYLVNLSDVETENLAEGDYLAYNITTQQFNNHKLTTSRVTDIDNTNKQEGAVLVYNATTEKYTATTTIDNEALIISGGTF